MRLVFVSALAATICACNGQSFSLGVVGGVRLTDDMTGNTTSESKRYTLGPMIDVGLPHRLGIEVDALYRRQGFAFFGPATVPLWERERANSWEVPILLKYRLASAGVKPFVEAGYAPRVLNGAIDYSSPCLAGSVPCDVPYHLHTGIAGNTSQGLVVGGGVQFAAGPLRFSPQLRYTHWNNAAIGPPAGFPVQSAQNQADVLVGIGWKAH